MENIYHEDQIDICNQLNSDCQRKYTGGCCGDIEYKIYIMKLCEGIFGTNNVGM